MELVDSLAWTAQIASCFYMTGVISVIQSIHYPSFKFIQKDFTQFHADHCRSLGLIAAPMMCLELASALWLVKNGEFWLLVNLATVVLLWALTFLVSVPAHNKLATGFDELAWSHLVKTNWWRTILWLARSMVFACVLFGKGHP
jgi:hypothetical protein